MGFIYAKGTQFYCEESPILLRGFGLGGWFLPEGYMWKFYTKCDRPRRMEALIEKLCGKAYAAQFWEAYFDSYITEKDIKLIAARGYNSVRMPINARKLYHQTPNGLVFDEATIHRLDKLIDWCRRWRIYVVLDMHGAPGGQTGANIDDSESDSPELFIEDANVEILIELWRMLAFRYKDEIAVAGYDLLNEPLPNWFSAHNDKLMPLYTKLIEAIRSVDVNHLIILEGLHWSTDFSIFDQIPQTFATEGIVLEFHKYWSNPDREGLQAFIEASERWNVPLFMGEGGENNNAWYTTAFPLYERLGISWSFWSYKKMACTNSPVTFDEPENWHLLLSTIDGESHLEQTEAIALFDALLVSIRTAHINEGVFNALERRIPVVIPAEAYDVFECQSERTKGANLRMNDPISILFESGKEGDVEYTRYAGEPQPEEENLMVLLKPSDSIGFRYKSDVEIIRVELACYGDGELLLDVQNTTYVRRVSGRMTLVLNIKVKQYDWEMLTIRCSSGTVFIDTVTLLKGDGHENHTDAL